MRRGTEAVALVIIGLLAGLGCSSSSTAKNPGTAGTTGGGGTGGAMDAGADVAQIPFEEQVLAIAADYLAWGRVDDELRWAPDLCRQPLPGVARQSGSDDPGTHGQKLYSVFAKNRAAYPSGPQTGQVVVKQSWRTEAVTEADGGFAPEKWRPTDGGTTITADHFYPYAKGEDGGVFRATEPAGLYLMWKVEPATPDTDEGWVYATILPSGEVTAAGRVSSCMGCHEVATHERLFGVPTGAFGL